MFEIPNPHGQLAATLDDIPGDRPMLHHDELTNDIRWHRQLAHG